mmetsp:Transcript_40285/g.101176  ORF Transcript_40285/g.101176 Transcript_40285/m.101176 type:complete len:205 (-) Transcript_40285:397-1011(-)
MMKNCKIKSARKMTSVQQLITNIASNFVSNIATWMGLTIATKISAIIVMMFHRCRNLLRSGLMMYTDSAAAATPADFRASWTDIRLECSAREGVKTLNEALDMLFLKFALPLRAKPNAFPLPLRAKAAACAAGAFSSPSRGEGSASVCTLDFSSSSSSSEATSSLSPVRGAVIGRALPRIRLPGCGHSSATTDASLSTAACPVG